MTLLTQAEANQVFEYQDGVLYWRVKPKTSRKKDGSNEAGSLSGHKYKKVMYKQKMYYAHQIIFLLKHGYIPSVIDHIDGNTINNKIENLRESNKSFNACNSKKRSDNTSGHKGVSWHNVRNKWKVSVQLNKKSKHIGLFEDFDFACLVADEVRRLYHGQHASV